MTDDLFDDAPARPGRDSGTYGLDQSLGRYRFPAPPGHPGPKRNNGWRRTTNLVKAFSDQYALQQWLERMTLLGLLANDGLIFDELAAVDFPSARSAEHTRIVMEMLRSGVNAFDIDFGKVEAKVDRWEKDQYADWAEKARTAAGADTGARKGTARHNVLEHYIFAGEVIGHRRMQVQMHEMINLMDECDFEFIPGSQENFIWHPIAGGVVGKRDARFLCRRTGQVGTIDLKTQERFWTYQEHAGQQWVYDTAPFVWEGPLTAEGRWVGQERGTYVGREGGICAGKPAALLIHMPSKGGQVALVELDLSYGREVVEEAARIVDLRDRGKKAGGICPA